MGVKPIGNNYHGFIFAGENSRDYGVYITEPAVFDAPERDVDMLTIPGRNGELVKDNGRFRNINVTYHCALPAESDTDFNAGIADFRNMLASKIGYQELSDEINTGEFRQGAFIDGMSVETVNPEAGTFDVVFNCKPQRFLTTGQTAVDVTSGDSITNPTLFPASPQLQIWGYGDIDIGGQELSLYNSVPIGNTLISNGGVVTQGTNLSPNYTAVNSGDTVTVNPFRQITTYEALTGVALVNEPANITVTWNYGNGNVEKRADATTGYFQVNYATALFQYGTAKYIGGCAIEADFTGEDTGGNPLSATYRLTLLVRALSNGGLSYVSDTLTKLSGDDMIKITNLASKRYIIWGQVYAFSTLPALGTPTYIDLDIGEAYKIVGDVPVSVNNAVTIPAVLPTLSPGANTITFDNTITQFKIVPRWWTV